MNSVVETIENGSPMAVAVQTQWLKNNKLYWPPGKTVDRQTISCPQANWLEFDYKLLKSGIGIFSCFPLVKTKVSEGSENVSIRILNIFSFEMWLYLLRLLLRPGRLHFFSRKFGCFDENLCVAFAVCFENVVFVS